ncbi:glycosyltransferase family 2 protein [Pontibacterium granulatum]|uniref:glycosyltransferase family 2 protein n=1 Tax=Pontibacterium granulatum TaxID=2036029 RepID=UPI00249C46EA|nr:glycosyltransferase family 2 protein [Pontibacterium granulatum]MDI3322991.1 glycosyltransferase family 2 protein [Pontibacterium granulatum]
MKISIVAPFHNEEENVDEFFNRVLPIIRSESDSIEIVCVNDGSRDSTLEQLRRWREKEPVVRVVNLSRNFGKENALTAGLDHASGDVIIPMDSDLQDPPELIPEMIAKWRDGYDVVYARRTLRDTDTWAKRATAVWYYKLFNAIADRPIPDNTGDFRLMDRKVLDEVKKLGESARFMKGLFSWVGFKSTAVEYERPPRHDGKESLNFRNLWRLALDGITAFSTLPLKVWSYIGMGVAGVAFLYGLVIIFKTLILGIDVPGYASTMVIVLFLGGVQLLSLGVIGEYVGRIYLEVKKRPHYIVDPEDNEMRPRR